MPLAVIVENGSQRAATLEQVSLYLRKRNVSCRSGDGLVLDTLSSYGIYPLQETPEPSVAEDEIAVHRPPVQINGIWVQQWEIIPKVVQSSITPQQFKKRLVTKGRWAAFKSYVATLPVSDQLEWIYADVIERNGPLITALQSATGLTNNQIDAVFRV